MKKRILKLLGCLCLLFVALFVNYSDVKASLSYDDFSNFGFVITPIIKNGDINWTVVVDWETKEELKYVNITMMLENGHMETTYETGRRNLSTLDIVKHTDHNDDTYWSNHLEFNINSADLQMIKLQFEYSYEDSIEPTYLNKKVIFLSTGNTSFNNDINYSYAFLAGIIISICASIATYIIIQNTKNNLIEVKNKEEEDIDDEE